MGFKTDFAALARSYDELRPTDDNWWRVVELVAREGELRGRRVLDVGCGTGRWAAALAERFGCEVTGVDVSPEMLEVARERVPHGVDLRFAAAERLPFADGSFERVLMTLVVHHVERGPSFAEARRVLERHGKLVLLTFDPEHFAGYYLNRYFPSFLPIDTKRFVPASTLTKELRAAGLADVRVLPYRQSASIDRNAALAKIRGRHISTFQLISGDEYEAGLARAERELPERVEYHYRWLIVRATMEGR
jgi:ubiquinone/menaquinone biosynthesis C-methylase UbiE